ncbi:unnamed protein product, partial [Rotaria magnacalcarata]
AQTEIHTILTVEKRQNDSPAHIAVRMKTSNNTIIRVVAIFAEGLFKGECLVM